MDLARVPDRPYRLHGKMRTFLHLVTLLLASLTAMAGACAPAQAQQTRPRPAPAVLNEVLLISESPTETRFRLSFAPKANTFAKVGEDPAHPAIGLALTTRGSSAVMPMGMVGLVRSIAFDQVETVLILRFATTAPAKASAVAISDTTIEITVSTGTAVQRQASGPARASGPLPAASEPPPGEDGYELVMLKYADVSEVVGILTDGLTVKSNDTFIPREPAFGSNSLTGAAYNPTGANFPGQNDNEPLGQSVDSSISIDRRLNAIWIKGSPERIARIKRQIELIDQPVDSVILETEIVELTESGSKAVGIDFTNANGQIAVATFQSGQYIPPGELPSGGGHISIGGRETGGNLSSVSLQAAVYAQVSKGEGRIVSKPRIAAQSGSTAKIITGDALPILTAITLSGVNGVSQQVQYVNVGVTLQIAPRVSSDGFVTSHVFSVVSSVSGFSQGYPTISQREAETSATVRDGESFVIGGLTQESTITTKSKVPLLGDIPLLSQAFRTDRKTRSRTELYIVVTPHIVRRAAPVSAQAAVPPATTAELPPASTSPAP
ncbi:MAG: type II secretion system protein GspD [Novosphingobium sp.]